MTSPRIAPLALASAEGATKTNLDAVQKMLGTVPNMFLTAARAPATLETLLALLGTTGKASLNAKTRAALALTVAETNGCNYCLSAHTFLGRQAKLSDTELDQARDAAAGDPKTAAVLRFGRAVVTARGQVTNEDIAAARAAGVSDAELLDTVSVVILNVFTNYLNLVAETVNDFPVVAAHR